MKHLISLALACLCISLTQAQTLNFSNFSPLCDNPSIDLTDPIYNDNNSAIDISGMATFGSNQNYALSIQQSGLIRLFETSDYGKGASAIGEIDMNVSKDFEGVTYLFSNGSIKYFATCNEDDSHILIFSVSGTADNYTVQTELNGAQQIYIPVKNTNGTIIDQGDNEGLEGISYDPDTGKLYISKESGPPRLYISQSSFFGLNDFINTTDIIVSTISTDATLFASTDYAGLFHLNQNQNFSNSDLMIILSEKNDRIFLVNLANNPANIVSSLQLPGIHDGAKIEGVVYQHKTLIVCNDGKTLRNDGYSDYYTFMDQGIGGVLGDVTCDGEVLINDAYSIARHAVGLDPSNSNCPIDEIAGDVTFDGIVIVNDAYQVARCAVGLKGRACPCR